MSDTEHDPLLQMMLALRADLDELRDQESATPKTGTWTPAFVGTGSPNAGTFTYSDQSGIYWLIGHLVIISGRIAISAISVAPSAGNVNISGLPFTSAAAGNYGGVAFTTVSNYNYNASSLELHGYIGAGSASILLRESVDNAAIFGANAANFNNVSCDLRFVGAYLI